MKTVVWTKYGSPDVLQVGEMAKPTPQANEVCINIMATTVTTGDCEMRRLHFPYWVRIPMRLYFGLRKPTRVTNLGSYLAGEVEAIGPGVTRFKVGDQLFGTTGFTFGTYAEAICVAETSPLAIKPVSMSYAEATAVPLGGLEALHFLRMAAIRAGESVLINGAGGSIGTFGIQLANYFGAEVTAVDSAEKLATLRAIGADHVIDYRQEDFTRNGRQYDVIFDIIGKSPFAASVRALKPNGRYLVANPSGLIQYLRGKLVNLTSNKRVISHMTNPKAEDLVFLAELIDAGQIKTVVDRCFALDQIRAAHTYVESGQKVGNVIVMVHHEAGAAETHVS